MTLAYDPMLRLYETSAGRRFAYDGGTIVAEYNMSDALQARHVFGPGADEVLVTIDAGGNRSWLIADERGSIVAKTDASGAATAIMAYDAYGIASGSDVGRFRYTGQAWLPELGFYYYKARMYAPTLGRFMQTDPIGYADGLNLYAYVGNDPVNWTDPSGMQGQKPCPDGKPPEPDGTGGVSCGLLVTARLGTSRVWVGSGVEINGGGAGAPPQKENCTGRSRELDDAANFAGNVALIADTVALAAGGAAVLTSWTGIGGIGFGSCSRCQISLARCNGCSRQLSIRQWR